MVSASLCRSSSIKRSIGQVESTDRRPSIFTFPALLKPSPFTPLTTLRIGELIRDCFPAGVFNVIAGGDALGPLMTAHKGFAKISFTGSTATGRRVMETAAKDLKRITLELGGNAPFIMFDDADLDAAVDGAIASKFRNAGQTCVCVNRFYVQAGIYDAFASRFAERVAKLEVGAGTLDGVDIGPLIDEVAIREVQEHVDDALAQGAVLVIGGRRHVLRTHGRA